MEFELADLHEVKAWVLSFGAKAVVESPKELREEVEQEISLMHHNYANGAIPPRKKSLP